MRALLVGFAFPVVALAIWGTINAPYVQWPSVMTLLLLPIPCGGASALLLAHLSPRRQFDRRMRGGFARRLGAGILGGIVAVALTGILLILADRIVPDAVLVCTAGLVAGAIAVVPLSRLTCGACFQCGYDLSAQPSPGQPGFGRCPECGEETIERARPASRRGVSRINEPVPVDAAPHAA